MADDCTPALVEYRIDQNGMLIRYDVIVDINGDPIEVPGYPCETAAYASSVSIAPTPLNPGNPGVVGSGSESAGLYPICDTTTDTFIGYVTSILADETDPTSGVLYFYDLIGSPPTTTIPANSGPCLPDPGASKGSISKCFVDDTLSDGSALVPFTRIYEWNPATLAFELCWTYSTDPEASYTPVGTVLDPNAVGTAAVSTQEREVLNGSGNWSSTANTLAYTIKAIGPGAAGTIAGTFTDSEGSTTNLYVGETISFLITKIEDFLKPSVTVTSTAGIITIDFQNLA